MKNQVLISALLFYSFVTLQGQWSGTNPVYTSSKVGIGTSTVSYGKLQINATSLGTNILLGLTTLDATYKPRVTISHVTASNNQYLEFNSSYTSGTGYAKWIFSNGNVGIGTTNPGSKLHVQAASGSTDLARFVNYDYSTSIGSGMTISTGSATGNTYTKLQAVTAGTTSTGNLILNPAGGSVGIGTTSPANRLSIVGTTAATSSCQVTRYNGAGYGYPPYVDLRGAKGSEASPSVVAQNDKLGQVMFWGYKDVGGRPAEWVPGAAIGAIVENNSVTEHLVKAAIAFYTNSTGDYSVDPQERMRISSGGNVLIGKTTQTNTDYKLDIAGKIRANEVVVNATGADFVFEPDYKLPELTEVEKYIVENKRLPDISPAGEMKENGMNLSEMQTKLLQKIEELTLYIIELNKKNEMQNREIELLKSEIATLKERRN